MPSLNQVKGQEGERTAENYLKRLGYLILERNYRFKRLEIDLICLLPDNSDFRRGTLIFVEVKSRATGEYGSPESAVNSPKQHNLILAARAYVYQNHLESFPCQFDVVSVKLRKHGSEISHIQDAFRLS